MEGGILVDSEPCGGGGKKTKKGKTMKGDFVGGAPKKMLSDITNLQQQGQLKPSNQHVRKQSATTAPDDCTDQLLKENEMLMKLLASRNAVIESGKAELQKLQSNFQKLRMQNMELARANSQMLAELNSTRQRLRELQLELGCKNGLLKAVKLESKEKEQTAKTKYEITANESQQPGQTIQADRRGDDHCKAKKRRMSKSQSSGPSVIKQVDSTEKADNQRTCLRRQSVGSKSEKPGPAEDLHKANDTKSCVSHLQENLVKRKGLTSSGATVEEETQEDTESSGPSTIEQVHAKENIDKRRQSLRRQSARFKPEVPEPTKETREDTESSGPSTTEQLHTKENIDKTRIIRRQSARFKPEDSEQNEDLFEIDDPKFVVFPLLDDAAKKSSPTTSSVTSSQQNTEDNSLKFDPQLVRRSSVGRPLRRAAEKVQTYKEIPINLKMRRPD